MPFALQDKLKNTLCTQCRELKRKRDFPELKDIKSKRQQLTGICTPCKNWLRKRDIKVIEKEVANEEEVKGEIQEQVDLPNAAP